jgi:hypothetical protein
MFEKKKSFLDLRFGRGNVLMAAYIKVLDSHALYLRLLKRLQKSNENSHYFILRTH